MADRKTPGRQHKNGRLGKSRKTRAFVNVGDSEALRGTGLRSPSNRGMNTSTC